MKKPNAIILDTNVLVHDPNAIEHFMSENKVFLPTTVIVELDGLKRKIDIGGDARDAIRRIEDIALSKDPSFEITKSPSFTGLKHLDPSIGDHQIIATAHNIQQNTNGDFRKVKMISKDTTVRILSRELNLISEDYFRDQASIDVIKTELPRMNIPYSEINIDDVQLTFSVPEDCSVPENGGVVCLSDWNGVGEYPIANTDWGENFAAIRKGDIFKVIPSDIEVFGIRPKTINGDGPNWEQFIAIAQLMDPDIKCVFLQGSTGSGKTLLALAAALEQRKKYKQILITRPMIHLEDEDRMGFLPGDIDDKMKPWLRPIWRVLKELAEDSARKQLIDKLKNNSKIDIEPLDYIRGMTFFKDFLVVDESQNLTPHQIKTIITRSGPHSKMIFTGDLKQIDRKRRLDKRSSGLAYSSMKLLGQPLVAHSHFKHTVRSKLADLAEKML